MWATKYDCSGVFRDINLTEIGTNIPLWVPQKPQNEKLRNIKNVSICKATICRNFLWLKHLSDYSEVLFVEIPVKLLSAFGVQTVNAHIKVVNTGLVSKNTLNSFGELGIIMYTTTEHMETTQIYVRLAALLLSFIKNTVLTHRFTPTEPVKSRKVIFFILCASRFISLLISCLFFR